MIIVRNPEACTRCNRCVMACSFHHTRKFSLNASSIEVGTSLSGSVPKPRINIHLEEQGGHLACDSCSGEDYPFCVRFCFESVFEVAR